MNEKLRVGVSTYNPEDNGWYMELKRIRVLAKIALSLMLLYCVVMVIADCVTYELDIFNLGVAVYRFSLLGVILGVWYLILEYLDSTLLTCILLFGATFLWSYWYFG